MSMETQIDEVRALAVKLAAVTDRIEGRLVQVSEANSAASQAMVLAARQAGQVADDLTRNALAQFQAIARQAATEGLRGAAGGYEQGLGASAQRVADAAAQLETRMHRLSATLWAMAWKAFAAISLASLVVIGVAGYVAWQAQMRMNEAQWFEEINAARATGKLARCPEGGLCVMASKRWVRVDN